MQNDTLSIYGWLPAYITLVMGVAIFLINIGAMNKKYILRPDKYNSTLGLQACRVERNVSVKTREIAFYKID